MKKYIFVLFAALFCVACGGKQNGASASDAGEQKTVATDNAEATVGVSICPDFVADSAMLYINEQCAFGPRVTGTEAHRLCGDYIVNKFKGFGCSVIEQTAELTEYDGTKLPGRNIIASINPDSPDRVLVCAHWDCRPWADNDPDESNHHTPILAANDAASGVAVMLEMARIMQDTPISYGVDFICFDAEDLGTPDWDEANYPNSHDSWCLGSKYWASNPHKAGYSARYGILLDMVGGRGSQFAFEGVSLNYAGNVMFALWNVAERLGYGSFFPKKEGGMITDDHVPVNEIARIPCIDIIPYYEQGPSVFGPTWHTVSDTPENIDPAVLKAVGQTVTQMLYNDSVH